MSERTLTIVTTILFVTSIILAVTLFMDGQHGKTLAVLLVATALGYLLASSRRR